MPDNVGRPQRKRLPHEVPYWTQPGAIFFITICCRPRAENQLCNLPTAKAVISAIAHYHSAGKWYARLALLMPDHFHGLIAFPRDQQMKMILSSWKRFIANTQRVEWQDGFFDYRLRNADALQEKAHYIRQNPVRAGLVADAKRWPYIFEPSR